MQLFITFICDAQLVHRWCIKKGTVIHDRWPVSHHNSPEALPSATVTQHYWRPLFPSSHSICARSAVTFHWLIHSITSHLLQLNWLPNPAPILHLQTHKSTSIIKSTDAHIDFLRPSTYIWVLANTEYQHLCRWLYINGVKGCMRYICITVQS